MTNTARNEAFNTEAILRWPSEDARLWLIEFLKRARVTQEILAVVAIGSSVRPDVASKDLDLVVISSAPIRTDTPPIDVDLRTYVLEEIEHRLEAGHDLATWAIRYGKPLLDKNGTWTGLVTEWRSRIPLPSRDEATNRFERTMEILKILVDSRDTSATQEQLASALTHLARAVLIRREVYPLSRPEIPKQLRDEDEEELAELLEGVLNERVDPYLGYRTFTRLPRLRCTGLIAPDAWRTVTISLPGDLLRQRPSRPDGTLISFATQWLAARARVHPPLPKSSLC